MPEKATRSEHVGWSRRRSPTSERRVGIAGRTRIPGGRTGGDRPERPRFTKRYRSYQRSALPAVVGRVTFEPWRIAEGEKRCRVRNPERSVDWAAIARSLDLVRSDQESASTRDAKAAIAQILGRERIEDAVKHYISGEPGAELARHVLRLLRTPMATEACYEVYANSSDATERLLAVELLRSVSDASALSLLDEFLADRDPSVQLWGFLMVDDLVWNGLVERERVEPWVMVGGTHANRQVRDVANRVRAWLDGEE